MAWEWVGPTATGTVGIVGVITTYLSGERGRKAQREQAAEYRTYQVQDALAQRQLAVDDQRREQRRDVYARFLSRQEETADVLGRLAIAVQAQRKAEKVHSPDEAEARVARDAALLQAFNAVSLVAQVFNELMLVNAQKPVRDEAREIYGHLARGMRLANDGEVVAAQGDRLGTFIAACLVDLGLVEDAADVVRTEEVP